MHTMKQQHLSDDGSGTSSGPCSTDRVSSDRVWDRHSDRIDSEGASHPSQHTAHTTDPFSNPLLAHNVNDTSPRSSLHASVNTSAVDEPSVQQDKPFFPGQVKNGPRGRTLQQRSRALSIEHIRSSLSGHPVPGEVELAEGGGDSPHTLKLIRESSEKAMVSPPFTVGPLDWVFVGVYEENLEWFLKATVQMHICVVMVLYGVVNVAVLQFCLTACVFAGIATAALTICVAMRIATGEYDAFFVLNIVLMHLAPVVALVANMELEGGSSVEAAVRETMFSFLAVYVAYGVERKGVFFAGCSAGLAVVVLIAVFATEVATAGGNGRANTASAARLCGTALSSLLCQLAVLWFLFRVADLKQRSDVRFIFKRQSAVTLGMGAIGGASKKSSLACPGMASSKRSGSSSHCTDSRRNAPLSTQCSFRLESHLAEVNTILQNLDAASVHSAGNVFRNSLPSVRVRASGVSVVSCAPSGDVSPSRPRKSNTTARSGYAASRLSNATHALLKHSIVSVSDYAPEVEDPNEDQGALAAGEDFLRYSTHSPPYAVSEFYRSECGSNSLDIQQHSCGQRGDLESISTGYACSSSHTPRGREESTTRTSCLGPTPLRVSVQLTSPVTTEASTNDALPQNVRDARKTLLNEARLHNENSDVKEEENDEEERKSNSTSPSSTPSPSVGDEVVEIGENRTEKRPSALRAMLSAITIAKKHTKRIKLKVQIDTRAETVPPKPDTKMDTATKIDAMNASREMRHLVSQRHASLSSPNAITQDMDRSEDSLHIQQPTFLIENDPSEDTFPVVPFKRVQKEASELFSTWDNLCYDGVDQNNFVSYEEQLRELWDIVDRSSGSPGTGYLSEDEIESLLELCGVVMLDHDFAEFISFCAEEGFASYLTFCAVFEDFRSEGMFTKIYSRPHVTAMCRGHNEPSSQFNAQRIIDAFEDTISCGDEGLNSKQIVDLLTQLSLPAEQADAIAMMAEAVEGRVFPADFVEIFKCEYNLSTDTAQPHFLQQARKALQRGPNQSKDFKSSDQQQFDRARVARQKLETKIPIVWLYCFITWWAVSVEVCFGVRRNMGMVLTYLLSDLIYAMWTFERALLPIEDHGQLIINKKKIIVTYITSIDFVIDFIVLFPLDALGCAIENRIDRSPIYRINKLAVFVHLNYLFATSLAKVLDPMLARISKALLFFLMQAHILSCLFKLVAVSEGDLVTSTILSNYSGYSEAPISDQYLQAYDYSIKTMSGLSRGTPMPISDLQHLNAILMVLTGVAAYAYFLATISNALQTPSQESKLKEQLDTANAFLQYSKVPTEFRTMCLNYYKHVATSGLAYGDTMLDDLPEDLQILTQVVTCNNVIAKVPIFQDVSDDGEFVYALSLKLRSEVVSPGQVVTVKGTPGSTMYFITHGEFELVDEEGVTLLVLKSGNFFGEIALLHNVRRTATIQASRFCNVLRLEKQDFEEVAELFPNALNSIRDAARFRIQKLIQEEEQKVRHIATSSPRHAPSNPHLVFPDRAPNPLIRPSQDDGVGKWLEMHQQKSSLDSQEDLCPRDASMSRDGSQNAPGITGRQRGRRATVNSDDDEREFKPFQGRRLKLLSVFNPDNGAGGAKQEPTTFAFGNVDDDNDVSEKNTEGTDSVEESPSNRDMITPFDDSET